MLKTTLENDQVKIRNVSAATTFNDCFRIVMDLVEIRVINQLRLKYCAAIIFSSIMCAYSSKVESFSILKYLRISLMSSPLTSVAIFAQASSINGLIFRELAAKHI